MSKKEILSAVDDNERALAEFTGKASDGSLGELDYDSALDLATRASASADVVANAFGRKDRTDATPDGIRERMMDLYSGFEARRSMADRMSADSAESEQRRAKTAKCLFAGLSDSEVSRVEFDAANGDLAPLVQLKSKFVFG